MDKTSLFPIRDCTAIILAGGKSRRMSFDKKYLKIEGSFLLDRVISNVSELFSDIIISTTENFNSKYPNINIVRDTFLNRGPIGGILSGLENSLSDKNFIIAADIPEISGELISEMYLFTGNHEIVIPQSGTLQPEPLFGFYKKSIIPYLRKNLSEGNNKIIDIYNHTTLKTIDMKSSDWFFNLNTESDLSDYLTYLKTK